jgi:hypothetical protein
MSIVFVVGVKAYWLLPICKVLPTIYFFQIWALCSGPF